MPTNGPAFSMQMLPLARVCALAATASTLLLLLAEPVVEAWTSTQLLLPPQEICGPSLPSPSPSASHSPTVQRPEGPAFQRRRDRCRGSFSALHLSSSPGNGRNDDDYEDDYEDDYDENKEEEDAWYENLDVLLEGENNDMYGDDTADDWIPDAEKARGRRPRGSRELIPANEVLGDSYHQKPASGGADGSKDGTFQRKDRPSPYTEEEEDLIAAMGGKEKKEDAPAPREIGFLGDSTLREISRDYSVPICYLADVLAMWGVPVPINVNDRLGDLVTGEQAFALVEAVNTLDVGYLNDRYSNQNILQLCDGWEIDIKDAFEFAMKEGWSLPFGVRTNLRVEQEDELLRVFSTLYRDVDDD
ncbi:unnamed protein product [Pseudo-nitzschia multistriata]|uniref:Uncharacterized protein n=1 Tax=Pseudo-nitzschia multistriata TaxID=183589 RepID=A0A448ZH71_9STRA|nr:unnamed protein product [Pseudo-nitzschia multistriata]